MSTDSWIELSVALLSLLTLGLASLVEASLATVNHVSLRDLFEERSSAEPERSPLDRPQATRSAMLLTEIVSAFLFAVMLTSVFQREFGHGLLLALPVGAFAVTFVARVLPGVLVRSSGSESREYENLARVLLVLATPMVLPVSGLAKLLRPLAGRGGGVEPSGVVEDHEGRVENGGPEDLAIEEDEQEMISGILGLDRATVRGIMVPRPDIVAVSEDVSISEVVDVARNAGHSRIPVYRDSIDTIVGVVYAKDFLRFVNEDWSAIGLYDLLRPAYFVPESKRVDELLKELRQEKVHLAIVVDEYGGTAGLVTIEDILEEIVGEIQDEYDREPPLVERIGADEAIVDGRIPVDEIADIFETDFAHGETGTVGGFVQKRLGHIPQPGESVRADGLVIEVQAVEHHRIRKLRVARVNDDSSPVVTAPSG